MMKHKNAGGVLCALLAVLMLLSSCSFQLGPIKIGTPAVTDVLSVETGTGSAAIDPPETAPAPKLEDFLKPMTADVFYLDVTEFPMLNASHFVDGRVFLTGSREEEGKPIPIALFDLATGKTVTSSYDDQNPYDYYSSAVPFMVSGHAVIVNTDSAEIICYDNALNITDTTSLGSYSYYCSCTQLDDDHLILVGYSDHAAYLITVDANGKITAKDMQIEGDDYHRFANLACVIDASHLIICYDTMDGDMLYAIYDIEKKTSTPLYFEDGWYLYTYSGETILTYNYLRSEAALYPKNSPSVKRIVQLPEGSDLISSVSPTNQYLYSVVHHEGTNESVLERRSFENGSVLASALLDSDYATYVYNIDEVGDYVTFVHYDTESTYRLCFWKPVNTAPAPSDVWFPLLSEETMQAKLFSLRNKLETEYGVAIFLGNDAVRFFNGYAVVPSESVEDQYNTLKEVKTFFDALPEGFLAELESVYDGISLYLTGRILPDSSNRDSIGDAAAFTFTDNDVETIVIDVTCYDLANTIEHEFMHAIETALYRISMNHPDRSYELLMRWGLLNPAGFQYSGVYTSEDGSTLGYDDTSILGAFYSQDQNADDIWFVDGYATTYTAEDLARCFEKIFPTGDDELPAYFSGIHMREKASYLCAILRDAFDSITDDVSPVWERALDPGMNLDYFRTKYDEAALEAIAKG
ncbi:MAG: hypothetical protein MJ175_02220 [Clostridia bacterium]|nr:hypothetical protein [Clostridia bacterium]